MDFTILGYYYGAWFFCIIGIGIIFNAMFFINTKQAKYFWELDSFA